MSKPPEKTILADVFIQERNHTFLRAYRRIAVQITTKTIIVVPYVIFWIFWIGDMTVSEPSRTTIVYQFVLSGAMVSHSWLLVSAYFNLRFTLDVWSYFFIIWALPSILSGMLLIVVQERFHGCLLLGLALASLADGLMSTNFRLPRTRRASNEEEQKSEPSSHPSTTDGAPQSEFFYLIPLDGSPRKLLEDFPQMSTPSTSSQAYDIANEEV